MKPPFMSKAVYDTLKWIIGFFVPAVAGGLALIATLLDNPDLALYSAGVSGIGFLLAGALGIDASRYNLQEAAKDTEPRHTDDEK